jgi:hypothetical protein
MRQVAERPRRSMNKIADALHIEDQVVFADTVKNAAQLADHCPSQSRQSLREK